MNTIRTLPGYSRYQITIDGAVYNQYEKCWLAGSTNPDGYVNFRLTDDNGDTTTIGRHRLIALLFLDPPNFPNAVVNHRNGVKGDDRIGNLEWTTYRGNLEHAGMMGLTEKCRPISSRNPLTNVVTHYPSAAEAARSLGITKDAMLWRLGNGEDRVYPEGLQYRLRDDARPWTTPITAKFGRSQATLVRDIHTGSVLRFERQSDISEYLGLGLSTINILASDGNQKLVSGRYQLKLEDDDQPWREIIEPLMENKRTRAVVAVHEESGTELVFASAKECAEAMGLKTTTLNERLKSNGTKLFKDGHRYRYYQQ